MSIFSDIGSIFSGATGLIKSVFTSEGDILKVESIVRQIEADVSIKFMELEKARLDLEAKLNESAMKLAAVEATSDSEFTRLYRPLILTGMFILICISSFGWLQNPVPAIFFSVFGASFGVVGTARSAEKMVDKYMDRKKKISP